MIIHISYIQHSKRDDESDLPSEPNQGFNNPSKMEIWQVTKKKNGKQENNWSILLQSWLLAL